jgi:hypothetical protein
MLPRRATYIGHLLHEMCHGVLPVNGISARPLMGIGMEY